MKDVQEAYSPQKRTSSTSKHDISYLFVGHFCRPTSMRIRIRINNTAGKFNKRLTSSWYCMSLASRAAFSLSTSSLSCFSRASLLRSDKTFRSVADPELAFQIFPECFNNFAARITKEQYVCKHVTNLTTSKYKTVVTVEKIRSSTYVLNLRPQKFIPDPIKPKSHFIRPSDY
jgi:hypothetical protein